MRVLLLQAPVANMSPHAHLSPPLGLAYVAAHLMAAGHDVELIDLNLTGLKPARLNAALNRITPQLVGISALTETYPNALVLAEIVKSYDATIPVIVGGPHATILPFEVLQEPNVDFVAVGEGERTIVELADSLGSPSRSEAVSRIAGLGHKEYGYLAVNESRPPLDVSEIGVPARQLLSLEFYEDAYNVLVSRGGCPYRCPFCSASHLWGGKRRPRPVADIIAEVADVVTNYGAEHVFFVDDILTVNRPWIDELLKALVAYGGLASWGCSTRVDCVDEDLLTRMRQAGCTGIQFGIESGAQSILDSVKGIDKAQALDAVRWAVDAGINVSCSFMVPFPDDTEETLAETLAFMKQMQAAGGKLLISYTTPFPGTMFAEKAEELGLRILTDDWTLFDAKHVVMETRYLSAARIEAIAAEMGSELGMTRTAG